MSESKKRDKRVGRQQNEKKGRQSERRDREVRERDSEKGRTE